MVKIVIDNLDGKELEVNEGNHSVLHHVQEHFIDWMHACGGKGRCTTCKLVIISGSENFAPLTSAEIRYLQAGELMAGERLACQARLTGNVVIRVPEEGKMPHMKYSD